jgi:RHS repeat-associated protein
MTQAQTSPAPYTTYYRYDAGARLVATIEPSANGTSGPFLASRTIYNAQGVVDHVDEGSLSALPADTVQPAAWAGFTTFKTTTYTYDNSGRKISESVSSGGTTYTFTQYNYDDGGRIKCVAVRMNQSAFGSQADACALGPEGTQGPDRITFTTYDPLDRPLQIQKAYRTALAYAYETNTYYSGGPLQSTVDAAGNYTYYSYDPYVRLQRWYFPSPTTKGSYNTADYEEYGYDLNGNRTTLRKRDGATISYTYDGLNRVTLETYPAGTIQNIYYGYDLRNLQVYARFGSATGPGLTTSFDGFGKVQTATTNQSGSTRSLSYVYDAEGNRQRITHPDNNYFQYAYDGLNRLTTIKENGTTTLITWNYDNQGRPWTLSRGAAVSSTTIGYDSVSRLQTLTQDLSGSAYDETRTFGYNPANQITSRSLNNATYSFTQTPNIQTTYSVNGLNQYSQLNSSSTVTPGYDPNGNMTFDGVTTFAYDVLNRMTSATATFPGGKTGNLSYDPKGRLFQTAGGPSGTTQFLYDGDALIAEYDGTGTLLRRYIHGSKVDEPLVSYEGATVGVANRRFFHVDQQGSVTAIADTAGNELQVNTYDPYGVPATGNNSRFQYTGQIVLPDLGQYYYKARIYNPTIGRFMQVDPIGYKDDMDLYSYVGEDPLDRTDPTGNLSFEDAGNFLANLASDPNFSRGMAEAISGVGLVAAGSAGDGLSGVFAAGTGGLAAPIAIPAAIASTAAIATGTTAAVDGANRIGVAMSNAAQGLPDKTIAKGDGVTVEHNYRSGDHGPAHAHVVGGGPETKIGANGKPIKGSPELTSQQKAVVVENKSTIRSTINKIGRWLQANQSSE